MSEITQMRDRPFADVPVGWRIRFMLNTPLVYLKTTETAVRIFDTTEEVAPDVEVSIAWRPVDYSADFVPDDLILALPGNWKATIHVDDPGIIVFSHDDDDKFAVPNPIEDGSDFPGGKWLYRKIVEAGYADPRES